jgi:hypothetical protein
MTFYLININLFIHNCYKLKNLQIIIYIILINSRLYFIIINKILIKKNLLQH